MKFFLTTWRWAKKIINKCPFCSLYNKTLLLAGSNAKDAQRNEIWKMDVFYFSYYGKLKYEHHTTDTNTGFQCTTILSSEKADIHTY